MNLDISTKTWKDIREQIHVVNPTFAKIIDELNPDANHLFFTAKLPYGFELFQEGKLHPQLVSKDLVPMGMLLSKKMEIYLANNKRPLPYWILKPGDFFGLAQLIDTYLQGAYQNAFCWDVSVGIRSIFLLSKISNATQLSKLYRQYPEMEHLDPIDYKDHWTLFRNLTHAAQDPWCSEVTFFNQAWFSHINDTQWQAFYFHLVGEAIKKLAFPRDSTRWQYTFSKLYEEKFPNYPAYAMDTVKHLFSIGSSAMPGFIPASNDEGAPISSLQRIFAEVYQLEYQPIIMSAASLNAETPALYYSLQYPTAIDSAPRLASVSNAEMLEQIPHIAKKCFNYFQDTAFAESLPMLHHFAKDGAFSYYHHLAKEGMVHSVEDLFNEAPQFSASTPYSQLDLPVNASFFKGCIKVLLPANHEGE